MSILSSLHHLKITSRMTISVMLLLLALIYSLSNSYMVIQSQIDFAEKEKIGNTFQKPLGDILFYIGDIRVLAALQKSGVSVPVSSFASLSSAVNIKFNIFKDLYTNHADDLQLTAEGLSVRQREHLALEKVEEKWTNILTSISNNTVPDDSIFISFISDIRGLIAHSGDTSNLVLDPDLDSYYLMDATVVALPLLLDRYAEIATRIIRDKNLRLQRFIIFAQQSER